MLKFPNDLNVKWKFFEQGRNPIFLWAEEGGEDHRNVLKKLIFLLIQRLKGDIIII